MHLRRCAAEPSLRRCIADGECGAPAGAPPASSGTGEATQANIAELVGDIQALRGEVAELRLEVKALKEAAEAPARR